ncbi:recombinase family protein [Serpentinicella alkaliphila]|uniref:Site-specific DNA recombinase n=1 Tax=Serpentinicella alkaliphila TaxID=1734049 RepID=A0A4R2TT03_9FIRM|nr:recombinase family protein [Serpentinicella alkaliphila]QUH25208.1 recombinase family protein [Serpentinicella alkaliphila]TCQ07018.1 site-specific DNA recombinase [Serpentinicella alkaliphila]
MEDKLIKNVVIYTRVSTEEQTEGFSLQNQLDSLLTYCKAFDYKVVGTYTDAGISGKSTENRAQYQDMLSYIDSNPTAVDAILIWKLSRISRKLNDLTHLMTYLEKKDIVLISKEDGINTGTATGRFMAQIVGAVSEMERDNIVSNARAGMLKRAELGHWGGGIILGYDNIDKKLVKNDDEAEIVKTIFDLYVNKDYGYSLICKHLNTRNMKTKKGNTWAVATVRTVLDNPTYAGYIKWGLRENWSNKRRKGITDKFTMVKSDIHEPIISEELWQQTRAKREKVGKANPKVWKGDWLLSGLPKCPACGASMVAHRTKRKSKKHPEGIMYRYYICSQYSNKDTSVCLPNLVEAETIEKYTVDKLLEFVSNPDLIKAIAEQAEKRQRPDNSALLKDMERLQKSLKELKHKESLYYSYLGDLNKLEVLKEDKIIAMIGDLNTKMADIEAEIDDVNYQLKAVERETQTFEQIALALKHFKVLFELATYEERKRLIHSVIKEIRIKKSDNFKERVVDKIILAFSEADVLEYLDTSAKKENLKPYVPNYDTVNRTISNGGFIEY